MLPHKAETTNVNNLNATTKDPVHTDRQSNRNGPQIPKINDLNPSKKIIFISRRCRKLPKMFLGIAENTKYNAREKLSHFQANTDINYLDALENSLRNGINPARNGRNPQKCC